MKVLSIFLALACLASTICGQVVSSGVSVFPILGPNCPACHTVKCNTPGTACRLVRKEDCPEGSSDCECPYEPLCLPASKCHSCDDISCGGGQSCQMITAGPGNFPCTKTPICAPNVCPGADLCKLIKCPRNQHCEIRLPLLKDGESCSGPGDCCPFTICESDAKNNPCSGSKCPSPSFCHINAGKATCVTIPRSFSYSFSFKYAYP